MKNRRFAIIAIVLVAVLCLGVAFATLTDELSVDGELSVNKEEANKDFNRDVHFDATASNITVSKPLSATTTPTAVVEGTGDDKDDILKITIDEGALNFSGEEVVVTAFVKNDSSEFDAYVTIDGTVYDSNNLCTITSKFLDANNTSTLIKYGQSARISVTIKLNETVTADAAMSGTFEIGLSAEHREPTP